MAAGNSPGIFGFDPRSVPGCILWLDAANDGRSLNTSLASLPDKSGFSNLCTPVSGDTITLQSNELSVLPTYLFGGYRATIASFNWTTDFTQFVVVSASRGQWLTSSWLSGYQNYVFSGNQHLLLMGATGISVLDSVNASGISVIPSGALTVFCIGYKAGQIAITNYSVNGKVRSTILASGAAYYGTQALAPLFLNGNGTGAFDSSAVGEFLHYNRSLSTDERRQIEGYLAWKWGLQPGTPPIQIPTAISGCQLWLDGGDLSTMTFSSGSNISTWNDKSGNGRNATSQLTAAILTPNVKNGKSVVRMVGTARYRVPYTSFPVSAYTVFTVQYCSSNTGSWQRAIHGALADGHLFIGVKESNVATFTGPGSGSWNDTQSNSPAINNYLAWNIVTTQVSSTVLTPFVNGTQQTTKTGTTAAFSDLYLGNAGGFTSQPWYGDLAEIIVFNTVFTSAVRKSIEQYLANKWDTGIFWSNHPFALARPHARTFQPVDIPGCTLWLDAADATTFSYSSGSNISVWRDKSGNQSNALGAILPGGAVPTFSNNTVNFGGTGYFLGAGGAATSSNEAIFVVASYSSSGNAQQGLIGQTANGGRFFYAQKSNSSLQNGSYNVANGSAGLRLGTPADTTFIGEAITRGGVQTIYTNAANAGTSVSVTYTAGSGGTIGVGFNGGVPNSNQTLLGTISEVIIYDVLLTPAQTRDVEGYLAWKWGLSTKLPGTPSTLNLTSQLGLWLDSADATTFSYSSGSNVSIWRDKSSNALHFSNATTSQQPTRVLTGNYPYVNFQSNATAGLYNSSLPLFNNTTWDMYCVIKLSTTAGQVAIITEYPGANNIWGTAGMPYVYSVYVPTGWALGNVVSNGGSSATAFELYQLYSTGSEVGRRINSTFAGSGTNQYEAFAYQARTGTRRMGLLNDSPSGQWQSTAGIQISEILVYNTALAYDQRRQVESYLIQKWGIIATPTPVPHPFYNSPSTSVVPLNPTGISNLALWLDATDPAGTGVKPANGSSITNWVDKSGNSRNATANTSITYATSGLGTEYPALTFTNTQWLSGNISITGSNMTVFGVFSMSSSSGNAARLISLAAPATNDYNNNSYVGILRQSSTNMGAYRNTTYVGATTAYSTPLIHTTYFDGTNLFSGTNGQPTLSGSNASTGVFNISSYTVGNNTNTGDVPNGPFNGFIGEIMVFSVKLSSSQIQSIEGYLAWKWGLKNSLPSTHAYYRFPAPYPTVPDFVKTATFVPTSIAGLVVWTDASTVTSVNPWTNGGSGGTINCTGTVNTAAKNGRNTVSLTTAQTWTMATTLTLPSYTMFWSGRQTGPNNGRVLQSTTNNQIFGYWGGFKQALYIDGNPQNLYGYGPSTNKASDTVWDTWSHSRSGAYTFNWDGTFTYGATSSTSFVLTGLAINAGANPGEVSQVEIGEIIVYNSALTTTQIQIVEGYLSWRWGVQANLPLTHPFYGGPP